MLFKDTCFPRKAQAVKVADRAFGCSAKGHVRLCNGGGVSDQSDNQIRPLHTLNAMLGVASIIPAKVCLLLSMKTPYRKPRM